MRFFYHHRKSKNSNINLLRRKLSDFNEVYGSIDKKCIVVLFHQVVVGDKNERRLEVDEMKNGLIEYVFYTEKLWGGNNPDVFWAKVDDDLICKMIEDVENKIKTLPTFRPAE